MYISTKHMIHYINVKFLFQALLKLKIRDYDIRFQSFTVYSITNKVKGKLRKHI